MHRMLKNTPPFLHLRAVPRELFTFVFASDLSKLGLKETVVEIRNYSLFAAASQGRTREGRRSLTESAGTTRRARETGPQRPPGPALTAPGSVGQRSLGQWAARSAPDGVGLGRRAAEPAQGSGSGVRAASVSNERTPGRAAGRGLLALPPPPAPAEEELWGERRPAPRRLVPRDPRSVCIPALL